MTPRILLLSLGLVVAPLLPAQEPAPHEVQIQAPELYTSAELEQLLGPIALYPDALVALILPAATEPSDIVLASRYLNVNGGLAQVDNESWDDSVKALVRYPAVLKWMDENLAWTRQLGEAFLTQPADVMNAIQRLRDQARASGALTDTPQQRVIVEQDEILIVPVYSEIIYVPRYDPAIVYVPRPYYHSRPRITFSVGYPAGHWLAYDCDWRHRTVLVVNRHHRHHKHGHDWRHHRALTGRPRDLTHSAWHTWRPPSHRVRHSRAEYHYRPRSDIVSSVPGGIAPSPGATHVTPRPGVRPRGPDWNHHDRTHEHLVPSQRERPTHWNRQPHAAQPRLRPDGAVNDARPRVHAPPTADRPIHPVQPQVDRRTQPGHERQVGTPQPPRGRDFRNTSIRPPMQSITRPSERRQSPPAPVVSGRRVYVNPAPPAHRPAVQSPSGARVERRPSAAPPASRKPAGQPQPQDRKASGQKTVKNLD